MSSFHSPDYMNKYSHIFELYRISATRTHPQRTLDNDRMVLAVEERVEELIGLFEREAYRLAPLKGADVSGMLVGCRGQHISRPTKQREYFQQINIRFYHTKNQNLVRISEICNLRFLEETRFNSNRFASLSLNHLVLFHPPACGLASCPYSRPLAAVEFPITEALRAVAEIPALSKPLPYRGKRFAELPQLVYEYWMGRRVTIDKALIRQFQVGVGG